MIAVPAPTDRVHLPVRPSGPHDATLAVVGDAPDWYDEQAGRPFAGPTGRLLEETLLRAGVARTRVYAAHVVPHRVVGEDGEDVPPTPVAIGTYRSRLVADLNRVGPKIVLACGAVAARALLGTNEPLSEIEGVVEHVPDLCCPVLPTWHPSLVLREGDAGKFEDFLASATRAVAIAEGRMAVPPRDEEIRWKHFSLATGSFIPIWHALAWLRDGMAGYTFAIDVETDGLDVVSGRLLQVAVGNATSAQVYGADLLKHPQVLPHWQKLLADPCFTWIVHNSSFDLQWLAKHFGVEPPHVVDTMCLALGTTERGEAVGLKKLSRRWLNAPYYERELKAHLPAKDASWAAIPRDVLAKYAAKDVVYTARMRPLLEDMVEKEGTRRLCYDLLMPAQRAFAKIEAHGILVDQDYLAHLEDIWAPKVEESLRAVQDYAHWQGWRRRVPGKRIKHVRFEERLSKRTGQSLKPKRVVSYEETWNNEPLNPRSPTQLCEFLFDHLKLRPPGGERTTGQTFRDAYPTHDFTRLHADFQLMSRMLNTYVRGIKGDIRADGRVHPSFALFGAVTGRLAMHHPPLQTIPREGTVKGRFGSIKRLFLPSSGHVWLEADYCVAPETRLLRADLTWAPASGVQIGDELIGFDEQLGQDNKLRRSFVESKHHILLPAYRIVTERGTVVSSADHNWVVRLSRNNGDVRKWVRTKDIEPGMMLSFLVEPWEVANDFDAGYAAGILDGEGSISNTSAGFAQNDGIVLNRMLAVCERYGLQPRLQSVGLKGCKKYTFSGNRAALQALGIFRPPRLLDRASQIWEGRRSYGKTSRPVKVLSVEYIGEQHVIAIGTSTKTYIAEGFYSHNCQLEVRVAWHLSGDEGLGQAIMSGDFHREMASRITGKPPEEIDEEERHASKRVSFGIMYGRGAAAIADQLTAEGTPTPPALAQGYIDGFFAAAPRYHGWYQRQIKQALTEGRSTTPFGRVRRWNLFTTAKDVKHAANQAVNFPVQSVASDLTLTALIRLTDLLIARDLGHVLFTVHDSICAEVREDRVAEAVALVREVMTSWPFESSAVLDVEIKTGETWGTVKEWA